MVTTKSKKALSKKRDLLNKPVGRRGKRSIDQWEKAVVPFAPTRLELLQPVPSDIEIAQAAKLKPILQVASELGIHEHKLEFFGPYKAKVKLEILDRLAKHPNGKYIDVTAITPTRLGEPLPPLVCARRLAHTWASAS